MFNEPLGTFIEKGYVNESLLASFIDIGYVE